MNPVMLIDFGSTFTKVCAIDLFTSSLLGNSQAPTTPSDNICVGLSNAINNLEKNIGKYTYLKKLACSSAYGGLTVMASGVVKSLTVKAAKLAALGAGSKVTKSFHHQLTTEDCNYISNNIPDIFLLAGGTDGGNQDIILNNAKKLASITTSFIIIVAGNRVVTDEIVDLLTKSNKEVYSCPNIMPTIDTLNILPVNKIIRELFVNHITEAKGLKNAENIIDNVLMPTPYAVLRAATLLADGTDNEQGLGELMVIDLGGATTDIHSICNYQQISDNVRYSGLIEPRIKRTVEGDIGVRINASSIISDSNENLNNSFNNFSKENIDGFLDVISENPSHLFDDENMTFDTSLSKYAIKTATKRHCGTYEKFYTLKGTIYLQQGKDFTKIPTIIGTGGPLIHSNNIINILSEAKYDDNEPDNLKPKHPSFYIDKNYILSAMGLLSTINKTVALNIMKKEITLISQEQNNGN